MIPNDHLSTGAPLSATGSLASVPCPECGGALARRSHRSGLAEKMLIVMYVYPFRCQLCGYRFFARQWGIRYHRISLNSGVRRPVGRPVRAGQFFAVH